MSGDYHRIRVAAYAIFRDGNKVLFMRRANTGFMDGRLGLPAGHVEINESVEEGLIREVREEVGVDVKASDMRFAYAGHRYETAGEYDYADYYFEIETWQEEFVNREPHKCSGLVWVDMTNHSEQADIIDYEKKMMTDIAQAVRFSSSKRSSQ